MTHGLNCGDAAHFHRRNALKLIGLSGLTWLTPLGETIARLAERTPRTPAKSLILLWLDGGNSQLETFDPHANAKIAYETKAIDTCVKGIQLAAGLPRLAEQMDSISLIRNVVTKEGDHERANYNVKTGYRPDPTLIHPSIGAVLAHQLPVSDTEIPRHISILSTAWPGRGGYLGNEFDAFKTGDPDTPIPDVSKRVPDDRYERRLKSLALLDDEFAKGRWKHLESMTQHRTSIQQSVKMMSSEQLAAFDVSKVSKQERAQFGNTPFGRACLAAARLCEVGVRCVEVNLAGWDVAHISNHTVHHGLNETLDPAFAGLIGYLKQRDRLRDTIVLCCGEFGRTPNLNPASGRDHWPHGFSIAVAGGGLAGGRVIGATDPEGGKVPLEKGTPIADVHATVMHAMGINFARELDTPVNRPMKLSAGTPIDRLFDGR